MRSTWPLWGIAAVALIESRIFVTTPEITASQLRTLPATITEQFAQHQRDLLIGGGVSLLGVLCLLVFITCLARHVAERLPAGSPLPWLVLVGGAVTGGAAVLGYSVFAQAAQAASQDLTAPTLAAFQVATDGLAYEAYTALALVTGAVAVAGLRAGAVPRWLAVFSAVVTAVLLACSFFPFVSWFPALLWTLVTGIGLFVSLRPTAAASGTAGDAMRR